MITALIESTFFLTLPSLGLIQKYFGTFLSFIYPILTFLVLIVIHRLSKKLSLRIPERQMLVFALFMFIVLLSIFSFVYPLLNSGIIGGGGDRDDDLNISARSLLKGEYPYYQRTYLGNPLSHLPGSIILAIPFVILGNSAYGNFFWLFVLFIFLKFYLGSPSRALFLIWLVLLLCPAALQEIFCGGDLLTNSIYLLIFTLMLIKTVGGRACPTAQKIIWAFLLGISFSSRWNYILLLPIIFSKLLEQSDLKTAIQYSSLSLFVFLSITLPFYLYDPTNFTPLSNSFDKINIFQQVVPYSGVFIILASGLFSLLLSLRRRARDRALFLENCALVQSFPVFCLVVLDSLRLGVLSFNFAGYGLSFLFFAALSAAGKVWKSNQEL